MLGPTQTAIDDRLRKLPAAVRSTVEAALRCVRHAAPRARVVLYRGEPPRSKSSMWKLVRYAVDGSESYVVGIGAFRDHATLFFPRGRELDDGTEILQGSGRQFRFITLRTPADVDRAEVKRMVREAFRLAHP
jgi:hypothetical protein